jgi:uncharacterized protein YndB with AHSA1/START domain
MSTAEITIDDKYPMVRITRTFNAPPANVFRAHVEPDLFAKWNWHESLTIHFDHFDCRTGGSYRITQSGVPELSGTVHGSFHNVIPNELIVQTFAPDGIPDIVVLERHHFEDLGGDRTRLTAQSLYESFEYRDAFLDSGLGESYDRLDHLLKTMITSR